MIDPLAQVVSLLQPDLSYSKFVEGAGAWRVRRAEQGRPFFCAMLQGAIRLEVQGSDPIVVEQGDFVLIPAAYDFASSSLAAGVTTDLTSMPTEVRPNVFRIGDQEAEPDLRMLIGYCAFGSTDSALLVTLLPALIHARGEGRLTTLIQFAVQEFRSERPARDVVLARLMELLFIEALRSSGPHCPSGVLKGLGDDRVAAAIRCIHESPTEAWTVANLARASAMSRSAFFDRFRQTVGMSPMEYLLHWRMILAKNLLRLREGNVAQIARRVGYGSASTFSVAFTRHVGVPPSVYGRELEAD
ncbi:AraC family transcriptional regulator [Sphingomonas abietis]|uniref:AraC family transcriptional regulator n=1 Tax=Sphingomonas abietis TaxID=3012344 RepID=A0ABY7NT20_9SPHN|nr:AraC family transcriptional regulator [Sphingomonas abietis]WBO23722.1 AraC family transcriptional regulator [Sphingomonas abietis]